MVFGSASRPEGLSRNALLLKRIESGRVTAFAPFKLDSRRLPFQGGSHGV